MLEHQQSPHSGNAKKILSEEVAGMIRFKVGDRVKVKDRLGWPGEYKIASWEGGDR
jgi:hypothetical protein